MKKLLEINRLIAQADTLSQGVIKSHFNILWEKYNQEVETYRFMMTNGQIQPCTYRKLTRKNFNNLLQEVKEISLRVS